jgi:hypothetical protein
MLEPNAPASAASAADTVIDPDDPMKALQDSMLKDKK